jgi:cyclic pyranopterin phosphate synthase
MPGHFDPDGSVHMVDVSAKSVTLRRAEAEGRLRVTPVQLAELANEALAKGDWRAAARIAGIQGAKQCAALIPLCHPLALDQVTVDVELAAAEESVCVRCRVAATGRTGVEMEALVGVTTALLTVYDMIKGIDKSAVIESIQLAHKSGGRSGEWRRPAPKK